ncbi:hypothetical protein HS7_01420 [Sulfolobales archaeon HS-7]|nr:hypothetical protein HS7_01420 [Sulfolobales archaeon HS-7]
MDSVCIATPSFPPILGGGEVHAYQIAKAFSSMGIRVEVHTLGKSRTVDQLSVVGHRFAWRCDSLPVYLNGLAMSRRSFIWNLYTLTKSGYVFTPHNSVEALSQRGYRWLGVSIANKACKIIAVNEWEKMKIESLGVTREKIVVIPNGLPDMAIKKPVTKEVGDYLLYIARVSPGKNQLSIIKVMDKVDLKLYMIGPIANQNYFNEIVREIKSRRLEDKVKYLGVVSDEEKYELIDKSFAAILFSNTEEAEGIAVKEAMARGKPVIVSANGALPFLVKNGDNGIVIHNEEELPNAIEELKNSTLRERIAENNIKHPAIMTWDEVAHRVYSVLMKCYSNS